MLPKKSRGLVMAVVYRRSQISNFLCRVGLIKEAINFSKLALFILYSCFL